jgi:SAM-dependent methyltransferase
VHPTLRDAALRLRSELREHRITPAHFVTALGEVPRHHRDEWLNVLWDIDEIPPDDPELPRGCVPYLPCDAEAVLEGLHHAAVTHDDVFVDVGAGAGRAALLAHLTTGASCIGVEIQPGLVRSAQGRADWLGLERLRFVRGDAADMIRLIAIGTVFFLYCPFGDDRLRRFLTGLEDVARSRPIRVCCVDMPPLEASWLLRRPAMSPRVDVYQSMITTRCSEPISRAPFSG